MDPEKGRGERSRYVVFVLALSYTACGVGVIIENLGLSWEPWALPFLILSIGLGWWLHLRQPFSFKERIYMMAGVFYALTFYQGVHRESLFDISLIICFVFFLFSLADFPQVFNVGLAVYFGTIAYQLVAFHGTLVSSDALTMFRILLHVLIVVLSSNFAKSMISGRQRAGEEQGRALLELSRMNKRTEDFLANISHELRTPINAVTGLSSVMLERAGDGCDEIAEINRAGLRLAEQVGDILDYTEIDTGRVILSEDVYEIYSVVNDVIGRFGVDVYDRLPDLIVDVEADVPLKLKGDVRRLKKILWHLLDNAFKFTRKGGIYLHVSAEKRRYGVNLCVEVDDTGIGISGDELLRVAGGYYQTDSGRSRNAGGMGLGLSIVYGFVHAMGGFISMDSKPLEGTRVLFSIPQAVVDQNPCMSVRDPSKLLVAFYLKAEKFAVPLVRDYYEAMIGHLAKGLKVSFRRAKDLRELKSIVGRRSPTHVFMGKEEFEEDPEFFRALPRSSEVIVVADKSFSSSVADCKVTLLRKPLYCFPIASILNALEVYRDEIDPLDARVSVSFPGLKVLVVDDEEMNLVVARGIFSGYGMDVVTAGSGAEAFRINQQESFDLVFMDHMMPEMDGVEAMKLLKDDARARMRDTRFVALTANAVSGAREMFIREGFDGFLAKPIETKEMERLLLRILPNSKTRSHVGAPSGNAPLITRATGEEVGIERCLGDEGFYRRLRGIFVEEMTHNLRVFKAAYATGDLEPYSVRLRALRDGSWIIGEDEVSRQARRVEMAIAKGTGLQEEHLKLCSLYASAVERLAAL